MNKLELTLVFTLVGVTGAEGKEACSTHPDRSAYSAWRTVDGKQCWYRGERGKSKEDLTWGDHRTRSAKRTRPPKEQVEVVPLPPTAPPRPLTEDLTDRLNYYFAVLSSQTYLQTPSGALPLAMAGPWVGTPIPPGLQPVPPAPAEWTTTEPKPAPPERPWVKRLWDRVWHYCCAWTERKTNP